MILDMNVDDCSKRLGMVARVRAMYAAVRGAYESGTMESLVREWMKDEYNTLVTRTLDGQFMGIRFEDDSSDACLDTFRGEIRCDDVVIELDREVIYEVERASEEVLG